MNNLAQQVADCGPSADHRKHDQCGQERANGQDRRVDVCGVKAIPNPCPPGQRVSEKDKHDKLISPDKLDQPVRTFGVFGRHVSVLL